MRSIGQSDFAPLLLVLDDFDSDLAAGVDEDLPSDFDAFLSFLLESVPDFSSFLPVLVL